MKRKVKVMLDGVEREVEVDFTGYVPQDEIDEKYIAQTKVEGIVTERLARQAKALRNSLLDDEDFAGEVAAKRGFVPKGTKVRDEDAIKSAISDYEKQTLAPLQNKLSESEKRIAALAQKQLSKDILQAGLKAGVKEHLLRKLPNGITPLEAMFAGAFAAHEDGEFYVKKGDSFAVSANASDDRLYKGVEEFFGDLTKSKDYTDLFTDKRAKGPNMGDASTASQKTGTIAKGDALAFGQNLEAIAKGEVTVE